MDHIWSNHGGTEGQLLQLVASLDRRRFRPQLVVLYDKGEFLQSAQAPVECRCLQVKSRRQASYWRKLAALVATLKPATGPALLHTVFPECVTVGPWLARLAGVPHVTWRRDLGYWHTPAKLAVLRVSRQWTACCVANSEAVRERVIRDEGFLADQVTIVRNAVDFAELDQVRPRAVRSELGLPPDTVSLVFPANLRQVKGGEVVLAALARARAAGARLHLVSIGENSELLDDYRSRCAKAGISEAVTFLGHLPRAELLRWVKGCDIAVNASYSEGYSNSNVEAMLLGLPLIATAVGGNVEQVVHGESGFLVPAGDAEAMAEALLALYHDRGLRAAVGDAGASRMRTLHRQNEVTQQHESLYERLLSPQRSSHAY
jgi:L-malate glycosyltransferase